MLLQTEQIAAKTGKDCWRAQETVGERETETAEKNPLVRIIIFHAFG
jgi:hypothetical protein